MVCVWGGGSTLSDDFSSESLSSALSLKPTALPLPVPALSALPTSSTTCPIGGRGVSTARTGLCGVWGVSRSEGGV